MADRNRIVSEHDFDPEELTMNGQTTGRRVRELTDPDAYVMLGKLASAVARTEAIVVELAKESRKDRQAMRVVLRRGAASTVGVVGAIQVIVETLRHAGVIK